MKLTQAQARTTYLYLDWLTVQLYAKHGELKMRHLPTRMGRAGSFL
jgi:hypothetical protein